MALVTITGYPSSGKSRRASQLKTHLQDRIQDPNFTGPKYKVRIISDDELNLDRNVYSGMIVWTSICYMWESTTLYLTDSRSEKPARGALFTTMQRQMSQDTILIIDSLNYIKGFRYQMYCAARELKLRVCTVSAPGFLIHSLLSTYYMIIQPK